MLHLNMGYARTKTTLTSCEENFNRAAPIPQKHSETLHLQKKSPPNLNPYVNPQPPPQPAKLPQAPHRKGARRPKHRPYPQCPLQTRFWGERGGSFWFVVLGLEGPMFEFQTGHDESPVTQVGRASQLLVHTMVGDIPHAAPSAILTA